MMKGSTSSPEDGNGAAKRAFADEYVNAESTISITHGHFLKWVFLIIGMSPDYGVPLYPPVVSVCLICFIALLGLEFFTAKKGLRK